MKTKSLAGRNFITYQDFTKEEIETILGVAFELKAETARGTRHHLLEDKTLFMLFYNRSLRTRNSFEVGMTQLGGHANYLDTDAVYSPAVEGAEVAFVTERVSDVARVLARYGDGISIRIFGDPVEWKYGAGNANLREFARWSDVPVINMEDDMFHPCQGIADLMTMKEKLGSLQRRKIVVSWAYSPSRKKPVSVPHSLLEGCTLFGADVVFARPQGFELDPGVLAFARENVARYGGSLEETDDMRAAFEGADVVYPKCWPSLKHLPPFVDEANWAAQDRLFEANRDWICDEAAMSLASRDCLYMHCLPCDRGYEVSDAVIDGPNSVVFDQAENRLHGQKAVMALTMRGWR